MSVNSGSIKVVKVVDSRCFQRLKLQPFNVDVGVATVHCEVIFSHGGESGSVGGARSTKSTNFGNIPKGLCPFRIGV